jgi:hypothetical protein
MAGSRKGEHRGGARKRGPSDPRFDAKTGTIKPKGGRPKGKLSGQTLIAGEREREMIEIITGRIEMMPKDVQLASMRTIYGLAQEYQARMLYAMRTLPTPQLPQQVLDNTVDHCETKMVQYLMLASQVARDAAPFIHPRLAALAVTTDRHSEGDLFDLLMKEIDQGPRFKLIEGGRDTTTEKEAIDG